MSDPLLEAIAQLRDQIEVGQSAIDEQRQALRVLEVMAKAKGLVSATKSDATMGKINIEQLAIPGGAKHRTLKDDVCDIIKRIGDQEFTVVHIEAALNQVGVEIKGQHPRSRIATILSKLEDDEFIFRVFSGKGNVPHRYKMKSDDASGLV